MQDPFADLVPKKQTTPGYIPGRPKPISPAEQQRLDLSERGDVRAERSAARADAAAERAAAAAERQALIEERKLNPQTPTTPALQESARKEALAKILLARQLGERSKEDSFVGGGWQSFSGIPFVGQAPKDFAADTATLSNAAALQRIMEMAATNGGKNPLTPLSNSDFQALASSLTNLDPGQSDEQYQRNLKVPVELYERMYRNSGGTDLESDLRALGGTTYTSEAGGTPEVMRGAGERRFTTDQDRQVTAAAQQLFAGGATREQMDEFARSYGAQPYGPELDAAIKARDAGGSVNFIAPESGREQISGARGAVSNMAASPLGAGITGAANALTLGGIDEIAGLVNGQDPAQFDQAKQLIQSENPGAYFGGELAGGLVGGGTLAAGMRGTQLGARLAAPGVFGRTAMATDAAVGGTYGALENNNNRVAGAVGGAALAPAAGIAGRSAANLIAPTVSPALRRLIDEGGRPTIGQIAGQGGMVGRTVKRVEDIVANTPVAGATVRNAQERAQSSINTAQINRSLRPIGQSLPKNLTEGHEAIDYAHRTLSDAYNDVLPRISGTEPAGFTRRLDAIERRANIPVGTEGEKALALARREAGLAFDNGQYTGRTFRDASERLGDLSRAWQKSDDPYLRYAGEAASRMRDQLHGVARKQNPQQAARLRSIDKGWASLVRTEKAALGSADGTFTAAGLNQAVRQSDGSARRNAVSRGRALDQDLARDAVAITGNTASRGGSSDYNALASLVALGGGAATGNPAALGIGGLIGANSVLYSAPAQDALRALLTRAAGPGARGTAGVVRQSGRLAPILGDQ